MGAYEESVDDLKDQQRVFTRLFTVSTVYAHLIKMQNTDGCTFKKPTIGFSQLWQRVVLG